MAKELRPEFPPEAHKQFEVFLAQYDGLAAAGKASNPPVSRPSSDAVVANLALLPRAQRWWTDLAQLELGMTEYLPDATVRARISGWRRRLREVVGEQRYAAYIASAPVTASAAIEDVRADLAECMLGVYYLYAGYGVAATSRDGLIRELLRFGGIIVAVELVILMLISLISQHGGVWPAILPIDGDPNAKLFILATWTSIAGVFGSVVSVQRRLEDPKVDADPYFRYIQTSADRLSVSFSSPFFGAVFGYVIFGLVASKIVLGSAVDLTKLDVMQVSIMLILGFLSGFAEQLVPDALTRVAARALGSVSDGTTTPISPPAGGVTRAGTITLTPSATNPKAGSKITIVVNAPGITGPIAASTAAPTLLQIGPVTGTAPGPASFEVTAAQAGTGTISVTAGSATASLQIQVV